MRRTAIICALLIAALTRDVRAASSSAGPFTPAQQAIVSAMLERFPDTSVTVLSASEDGLIDHLAPWTLHYHGCGETWADVRIVLLRRGPCEALWSDTLIHELCHQARWDAAHDDGHGAEWLDCYLKHQG